MFQKKGKLGLALTIIFLVMMIVAGCKKKEDVYRNIRVSEVVGSAYINRDDKDGLKISANMNLQSGDELITEKGAKVTLRLDDDKYLIVDEDSKLVLYAEGTKEDSQTRIELEYGAVFSDIQNKLSDDSGYEVVTPASVMSVRGTQFEVVYRELKNEVGEVLEKVMKVLTFEGEVYVKPEGSAEKRISKAGTMELLEEVAEGQFGFATGTKEIEAEDLSDLSATYLKEDISAEQEDLSEEEKAWKSELLEKIDRFLEGDLTVEEVTPTPEPTPTPAPVYTEEVYKKEDHAYSFVPVDGRSWEEINAYCNEKGGHLATITCEEENTYLYDLMIANGYTCAYFGYTDEVTEGEWKWVTENSYTYENWYEADVDNYREEDYAMMWSSRPYYWNDGGFRESGAAFICEWDVDENGVIPTPEPDVPEDATFTLTMYFTMVMESLGNIEAADMESLYVTLDEYSKPLLFDETKAIRETVLVQDAMNERLKSIAEQYVQADGKIKNAAEAVFGKKVEIVCNGFYSESHGEIFLDSDELSTFAEFGILGDDDVVLYPVYTVNVPEDNTSYNYIPCRMMINENGKAKFFMFMAEAGSEMELPKVEGYNMYWMTGSNRTEKPTEPVADGWLNWPIIEAESVDGTVPEDETAGADA